MRAERRPRGRRLQAARLWLRSVLFRLRVHRFEYVLEGALLPLDSSSRSAEEPGYVACGGI